MAQQWDATVDAALAAVARRGMMRLRPRAFTLPPPPPAVTQTFAGPGPWDRATVKLRLDRATLQEMLTDGGDDDGSAEDDDEVDGDLTMFSGNDYLCIGSHPAVRDAAAKAALEHGMGPRGSALISGYTTYHKLVEESLAELKKKEDCILCPVGFAANEAVMSALGSISALLAVGSKPAQSERIAIFSDALNHASIIDGIRLVKQLQEAESFVYRHCDMSHLESLLSSCSMERKVVYTDSLFSMDGDFAPLHELVNLRKKYGFLLVIDDAHGTFICGENGGGVAEMFGCEKDIDISVGTLGKGAGCLGGFIACSPRWKKLIQWRGRAFIYTTTLPVPIVASVHAAINVAKKEGWRRSAIWRNVRYFASLTKLNISSQIISIVLGSEEAVLKASSHLLRRGFIVTPIQPPVVPPNTCRLRITLSAAHSLDDIKRLVDALIPWLPDNHAEPTAEL